MRLRLTLAAAAAALLIPSAPAMAGDPTMPLSQVRSGMRCTGYSVVRGTDIASFDVEVLDVVDGDPSASGPRILIEASGPAVDRTGIGPGFSGSPIYCRDDAGTARNIGAISESIGEYGGKVVLATPIESILVNSPDAPRETNRRQPTALRRASSVRSLRFASASSPRAAAALDRLRRDGSRRLSSPLTISGLSPRLGAALQAAGRRLGHPVLATPAGPLGSFPVQQLRPGSAVAVGYSGGDLRIGAIGTVAYTDQSSVWAFGHPFEGSGARALLLQDAYVYRVINDPNAASDASLYEPPVIPIRVAAHDVDTGNSQLLHVTSADETDAGNTTGFSPISSVAPLAIAQGGSSVLRSAPGRLTGRMCLNIGFRETRRTARFCNRYVSSSTADAADFSGGNAVAVNAALDALDAFGLIDSYTGKPPHITKVGARIDLRRGEKVADLVAVKAPRTVRRGQRVRVRVALHRLRGPIVVRSYRIRIPRDVRPGRRRLVLASADEASAGQDTLFNQLLAAATGNGGGSPSGPASINELVDTIRSLGRYDGVVGKLDGTRFTAFRDADLLIGGRAETRVRVRR